MSEIGCLKDGHFQNIQVSGTTILNNSSVNIESASNADAILTIKSSISSRSAALNLIGDNGNDLGDSWKISAAGNGKLTAFNDQTTVGTMKTPMITLIGNSVEANRTISVYGKLSTSGDLQSIGSTSVYGQLFARGYAVTKPSILYEMPSHATPANGATNITMTDLLKGVLVTDPAHATSCVWTLPTAANAVSGLAGCAIGDIIDFIIINTGTPGTDEIITVVPGANSSIYGSLVTKNEGVSGEMNSGSSKWRLRILNITSGVEDYAVYRMS